MTQHYKLQNTFLVQVARNSSCAMMDQYHNPYLLMIKTQYQTNGKIVVEYIIIIFFT